MNDFVQAILLLKIESEEFYELAKSIQVCKISLTMINSKEISNLARTRKLNSINLVSSETNLRMEIWSTNIVSSK